jgi:hypothetical protein
MKRFIPYRSKILRSVMALVFTLGFGAGVASADNPHFVNGDTDLIRNTGALVCSWKEAGLGDNQNIDYKCSADATATYVCVNKGGANPSAQNKTTVAGPVSATGTFSSGKNGQITASLTLQPPPSDISCPNGQRLELAQASYTNVIITDLTNGIMLTIPGDSTGCLLPDVRGAC